jgi:NAD(P)-dependent dehydrogenase (short-subunit alcohol dehydrogenase family)
VVQWDSPRGIQGFGGLELRIPLGAITGSPGPKLNPLDRRMVDRVQRDVDIITEKTDKDKKNEDVIVDELTVSTHTIVFANAGGGAAAPLGQVTEAQFDKYFDINVKGTLFAAQKALPLIPAGGAIVITGSMASIKGIPGYSVYSATKAALRSFARTWSIDLKGRNIRVNVVSPGTVVTPAYKSELGLTDEQIEGFVAQAAAATPLGRTGTPDEIAKTVVFLASDDSSFVNGIELFVDGGAGQI